VELYLVVIESRQGTESQQIFQSVLRSYSDVFNISALIRSTGKALYLQQCVYYVNI